MTWTDETRTTRRARRLWRVGVIGLAGVAAVASLAACGGDDDDTTTATTEAAAAAVTEAPGATAAPAATSAPAAVDDYGYAVPPAASAAPAASSGAASIATAETDIGTVLVDAGGMTLYAFTADTEGEPTCLEGCADAWPPAIVQGEPTFGDLDASVFSTVENPAGTQLKAGEYPLYRFSGDTGPGQTTGHGSGDVWFAVAPDGTLID